MDKHYASFLNVSTWRNTLYEILLRSLALTFEINVRKKITGT